jgi:hypothetical protein
VEAVEGEGAAAGNRLPAAAASQQRAPLRGRIAETWERTGAQFIGGMWVAVALIHIAWLLSFLPGSEVTKLLADPWTYGDAVFGVGGAAVGYGAVNNRSWSESAAMCLCLTGVLTSVLWFAQGIEGVAVHVIIMNAITGGLATVGTIVCLFAWPGQRGRGGDYAPV